MAYTEGLSVGTKIYTKNAAPGTYDENVTTGFPSLAWTEVGEVESIGEFGGTATVTQFTPLASGVVKKFKGSNDYGQMAMVVGRLLSDAGQVILLAGFDGAKRYTSHSFKVESADGSVIYFTGKVASFSNQVNDANSVTKVSVNVDLDAALIYVAPV